MNRAVLYLLITQKKNSIRHFFTGLKRPRKLLGVLFWLLVISGVVFSQFVSSDLREGTLRSEGRPLPVLLGFLLVAAALGGLMQRGLAFQPADIDFLFPGPFERRSLVLYRLISLYPMTLMTTLFLMIFVGPRLASPWFALIGVFLVQIIALHLQTMSAILAATVSDRLFGRLKGGLQVLLLILFAGGMFAGIMAFVQTGGIGGEARRLFESSFVSRLLYPATQAGRLGDAANWHEAMYPLLGLCGCTLLSLAVVLTLQVNFFEASLETSQRVNRALKTVRRGIPARAHARGEKVRRIGLPPIFRGGAALFWKNLLAAGRSLRIIFFGFVMTAILTSVGIGVAREVGSTGDYSFVSALTIGAILPFILQQYVAFDFRRDIDCIAELKLIPTSATMLAAAEVAVPTLVALVYQFVLVVVAFQFVAMPAWAILVPLFGYPALTLAICTVTNLGFLMFPTKAVTASGRPTAGGASLAALINMLVLMVCLIPAVIVGLLVFLLSESEVGGLSAGLLTQYAVDLVMLYILGRLFRSFDVSRDF